MFIKNIKFQLYLIFPIEFNHLLYNDKPGTLHPSPLSSAPRSLTWHFGIAFERSQVTHPAFVTALERSQVTHLASVTALDAPRSLT